MSMYSEAPVVLNGVTTTTTSAIIDISQREQVGFTMQCTGHTSGNGVFTVNVSNDGINFVSAVAFQDATSTASTTWVTSKTLSSNTTAGGFIPLAPWKYMTYTVTVTTDGAYTVVHNAQG